MAKRIGSKDKARRRSIMLPDSSMKELVELRKKYGLKSDSEVIRYAFNLLKDIAANDGEFETVNRKTGQRKKRVIIL